MFSDPDPHLFCVWEILCETPRIAPRGSETPILMAEVPERKFKGEAILPWINNMERDGIKIKVLISKKRSISLYFETFSLD